MIALAAAFLAACSLAGDVTPPPGFEDAGLDPNAPLAVEPTAVRAASTEAALGFPRTAPSVAAGAALFAQNCTRCHGAGGAGDGPLAAEIQFPLPDFTQPGLARGTTPAAWFAIITDGNLDRLMPPWRDSLGEAERWSLVAYLYTLSAPPAQLDLGKATFEASCARCHGEAGGGDGPEAAAGAPPPSFSDQSFMAARSNDDLYAAITSGLGGGHVFADTLGSAERRAAVDYVRALSFDRTGSGEAAAVATGAVTGIVVNGTDGAATPAALPVVLHVFDGFQETDTITATLKSDSTFEFPDLDLRPQRAFIVSASYGDMVYASDVQIVAPGQTVYDLPIEIFETTTNPVVLAISQMHVLLEFEANLVRVAELYVLSNNADRTFVAAEPQGTTATFSLPAGYANLAFEGGALGERYRLIDGGFADTYPVRPGTGSQRVLVSYTLPYSGSLAFSHPIAYPAAAASVLLPDRGLALSSDLFVDQGPRDVQGTTYQMYAVTNLLAGDLISFELRGALSAPPSAGAGSGGLALPSDTRSLLIGILSLALVVAVVAYGWIRRAERTGARAASGPAPDPARLDELLDEIAELDEGFEAGEYPEADYRAEREKLKAEARALMAKKR